MAEYGQVDASIPLSAPPRVPMMQRIGQTAETMNALNQNKLFLGKQAAGAAIQQSIDPATGQVNWEQVNKLIRANPKVAPYAQEALAAALSGQGQNIQNTTNQANLAETYAANIRKDIGSTTDPAQALAAVIRGVATGRYPKEFAAGFIGGADVKALMGQAAIASGSETAMEAQFGNTQMVNVGDEIQPVVVNRVQGTAAELGPGIDIGLTPGEAVTPAYEQYNPVTKQKNIVTKGDALAEQQEGGGGPILAGPALGEEAAAEGSAELLTAARNDTSTSAARLFQLQKAGEALEGAQTGKGGMTLQGWRSFLVTMGIAPASEVEKVKNFDEAAKYLNGYALAAASRFGAGTDSQLATTLSSNASTSISNLAAQDVVKATVGLERMKQAQLAAFDASGQSPARFGEFVTRWNKDTDPRAFIVDQMTKEQRAKMIKGMNEGEQRRFLNSVRAAVAAGVLNLNDAVR